MREVLLNRVDASTLPVGTFQIPGGHLKISDVIDQQVEHLDDLLGLYAELFPKYVSALSRIRQRASLPADVDPRFIRHQWVVYWNDEPAGLVSFRLALHRGFGLCMSIAIRPAYRSIAWDGYKRLSDFLIRQMIWQMELDAGKHDVSLLGVLVEVESPASANDPATRVALSNLLARYQEYGFHLLPIDCYEPGFVRVPSVQPPDSDVPRDANLMQLCMRPLADNDKIGLPRVELLNKVIDALLIDHYELDESHWIVQRARASINEQGEVKNGSR